MIPAIFAGVGLVLGIAAAIILQHRSSSVRADGIYRGWKAEETARIRSEAADAGRLAGKISIGGQLRETNMLPFSVADARFVGHPVHLVVFDGDSEAKAGAISELREILLVTADTSKSIKSKVATSQPRAAAGGRPGRGACEQHALSDAELVAECVTSGRVRWVTLRYP